MLKFDKEITKAKMLKYVIINCHVNFGQTRIILTTSYK